MEIVNFLKIVVEKKKYTKGTEKCTANEGIGRVETHKGGYRKMHKGGGTETEKHAIFG